MVNCDMPLHATARARVASGFWLHLVMVVVISFGVCFYFKYAAVGYKTVNLMHTVSPLS